MDEPAVNDEQTESEPTESKTPETEDQPEPTTDDTEPVEQDTAQPDQSNQSQDLPPEEDPDIDRKSTRLNSSHVAISYAVFCLKKKKQQNCAQLEDTQA